MPICFRPRYDEAITKNKPDFLEKRLGEEGLDLSLEFDPESIEHLIRLKLWAHEPEHFVRVKTPSLLPGRPPGGLSHTLSLGEFSVYYAIEIHEHGSISKTYYHLCLSHSAIPQGLLREQPPLGAEKSLTMEDPRVILLILFFFAGGPPTQVQRCCTHGLHFFKAFEWAH